MQEGKAFADANGFLFFETSAKQNINVKELFLAVGSSSDVLCCRLIRTVKRSPVSTRVKKDVPEERGDDGCACSLL